MARGDLGKLWDVDMHLQCPPRFIRALMLPVLRCVAIPRIVLPSGNECAIRVGCNARAARLILGPEFDVLLLNCPRQSGKTLAGLNSRKIPASGYGYDYCASLLVWINTKILPGKPGPDI